MYRDSPAPDVPFYHKTIDGMAMVFVMDRRISARDSHHNLWSFHSPSASQIPPPTAPTKVIYMQDLPRMAKDRAQGWDIVEQHVHPLQPLNIHVSLVFLGFSSQRVFCRA